MTATHGHRDLQGLKSTGIPLLFELPARIERSPLTNTALFPGPREGVREGATPCSLPALPVRSLCAQLGS